MKPIATLLLLLASCAAASAQTTSELQNGFLNPGNEAKPRVWWHWMNGNITEDGLKKDLLWMDSVGVGGVHIFDANFSTPLVTDHKVEYMSEEWKGIFSRTVAFADSLGFEVTVASSPGFSATGGPWVTEKDAIRKLCWRQMVVEGGSRFEGRLPEPFTETGKFQDIRTDSGWKYYEDIAVIAVRLPDAQREFPMYKASEVIDAGSPITVKAVSFRSRKLRGERHSVPYVCLDSLQASIDGVSYVTVCGLPYGPCPQQTVDIEPVTARFFRLKTNGNARGWTVHTVVKVNHAEEKAGFGASHDLRLYPTPETADAIREVVDVSDRFHDGVLDWDVPEGRWKIYRFGCSLTGKTNHPASPEATGLEVDKLDKGAYRRYCRTFLDMMKDAAGGLMGSRGIRYVLADSYEAGFQNWTPSMLQEFKARRGYDALLWMPALAGEVLSAASETDRFLSDYRHTLGELFVENYDELTRIVREEYGMPGTYVEAHANGTVFPADGMAVKRRATVPMGEIWIQTPQDVKTRYFEGMADIRESSSVAHIYGQKYVAAESFTARGDNGKAYSFCPENIKRTADYEMKAGVNRFVIHDSAHQPEDGCIPGLGLGKYGQWFNRHDTWAHLAGGWIGYLARSSYMLQSGENVADLLWYFGENQTVTAYYTMRLPDVPRGYEFDYAGAAALLDMEACGSFLVAPSGARYRALYIDPVDGLMSVAVLKKLLSFASAGAVICGGRPCGTPSLRDDPAEWEELRRTIWDSGRYPNVIVSDGPLPGLNAAGAAPDVSWNGCPELQFRHRRLPSAEVYWVSNPTSSEVSVDVSFRCSGMVPSVWDPENGSIRSVDSSSDGGRTAVTLHLFQDQAVFVVFTEAPVAGAVKSPDAARKVARLEVKGPWMVRFQEGRGAPESVKMKTLSDLSLSGDAGVKYFSGTASYSTSFVFRSSGARVMLDLGAVKNIAQVFVNGVDCGVLWKAPFVCDITAALKRGRNSLEIKVTNLWPNRLIGDLQPDVKEPLTFVSWDFYTPDSPLLPSGLIGPVEVGIYSE